MCIGSGPPLLINFFVIISPVISIFLFINSILYFILKDKKVKKKYLHEIKLLILILVIVLVIMVLSSEFYFNYYVTQDVIMLRDCIS